MTERKKPGTVKDKIRLKDEFVKRYKHLLNDRYEEFVKCSLSYLRRSIRINTIKTADAFAKKELQSKGWKLERIPFCREGYWVKHEKNRLDIGNTIEHKLGYYYVQQAASMIPPLVLNPKPGENVLDMCAAPGSKTTQIAQYMENKGIVIANDYKGIRMKPLSLNIQRSGLTNVVVTLMFGQWFEKTNLKFDRILVDAPCSGTGSIRKSFKTLRMWNPLMIKRLASTQKKLLKSAYAVLKVNGTLVYSTCSTEPEENEGVITSFLKENVTASLEKAQVKNLKTSATIKNFEGETYHKNIENCIRIWPQDNDTEGFFIAKIKKFGKKA